MDFYITINIDDVSKECGDVVSKVLIENFNKLDENTISLFLNFSSKYLNLAIKI